MKLNVYDLHKSFGTKVVLDGVNASFEQGKIYALLGRNGSGKTTFFNCVSQEIPFDSGTITLEPHETLTPQDVGYVYATPTLPEFLTGYEFLAFFCDINKDKGLDRKDINTYFDKIQFDIDDRHKLIKEYSLGMRNKLQMISILMLKPKILFLDEPLTSFDVVASVEMKKLLVSIKESCIMILATHVLQIAKDICDEVVILHHGTTKMLSHDAISDPNFEDEILEMLSEPHEKQTSNV